MNVTRKRVAFLHIVLTGFVYITDCPFEPMIPICLVVAGFIKLFKDTVALVRWRSEVNYIRANAAKPEGNIESVSM